MSLANSFVGTRLSAGWHGYMRFFASQRSNKPNSSATKCPQLPLTYARYYIIRVSLWQPFNNSHLYLQQVSAGGAEPQVAVLCEAGATYHPQYMSAAGRWTPDLTTKPRNCLKDKMEILDYCKKVRDCCNLFVASSL